MTTTGLLLAAGAGRRMGRPKALVDTWLVDAVTTLREGGCARVTVVLGAGAEEARPLLEGYDVDVVVAEDWDEGMGASLRTGLQSLTDRCRPLRWSPWSTSPTSAPTSYAGCSTDLSPRTPSPERCTTGRPATPS